MNDGLKMGGMTCEVDTALGAYNKYLKFTENTILDYSHRETVLFTQ